MDEERLIISSEHARLVRIFLATDKKHDGRPSKGEGPEFG